MKPRSGIAVVAGALAGLLLFWGILKESREPFLLLFVVDLITPPPEALEVDLPNKMALRLHTGTQPHIGKIARLQKGLVLAVDGRDRIEEGFGFGLPLVEVDGQAYVSRTATVKREGNTLVKRFLLDTLDTPSGFLRRKYEPVSAIGAVTMRYEVREETIHVTADFAELDSSWTRAYLMNEQGARFFTTYEEQGLSVGGDRLGKWQATEAPRGCMVASDGSMRFCVETEEPGLRYFGRERYYQYYWIGRYSLSWAGIDLELEAPATRFEYEISLEQLEGG
jgi:hypothetical protein